MHSKLTTTLIVALMTLLAFLATGCADIGAPVDPANDAIDQPVDEQPPPPAEAPVISFEMREGYGEGKNLLYEGQYDLADGGVYTLVIDTGYDQDEVGITYISTNCTVLEKTGRSITLRYDLPDGVTSQDVAPFIEAERTTRSPLRYFRSTRVIQAVVEKATAS